MMYIYSYVSYSRLNGWTEWAEMFERTPNYLGGNTNTGRKKNFLLKNRSKKYHGQCREIQLVFNYQICVSLFVS